MAGSFPLAGLARLFWLSALLALLAGCDASPPAERLADALWAEPAGLVLTSSQGPQPLDSLKGKVLLVSFGYTHCPDVCPANLGASAQAVTRLSPAERERVRFLMVAVDPARDTAAAMAQYLAFFHPDMLGLVAPPEQLARIAKAFKAIYILGQPGQNGEYAVDHSAQTWLLNSRGELVRSLDFGTPTEDILAALRKQLGSPS